MDILQICRQLRPGTAWTCNGDRTDVNNSTLRQADDGTPRVSIPTQDEIQAFIAAQNS